MEYAYPGPYPEIKVMGENHEYAKLLLEDYAGENSELSAVLTYVYQHFIDEMAEDFKEAILQISMVEMKHQELLGECINALGVNPKYRVIEANNSKKYFDTSTINYEKNICKQIKADYKAEEKAIKQYKKHMEMIDDPYVKNLLKRIILDEEVHQKVFKYYMKKYCANYDDTITYEDDYREKEISREREIESYNDYPPYEDSTNFQMPQNAMPQIKMTDYEMIDNNYEAPLRGCPYNRCPRGFNCNPRY